MTVSQREFEFQPANADRLADHLRSCGVADIQARLAALVLERGVVRLVAGERMRVLTIGGRDAAKLLGCAHRSIGQAAAALERFEWFRQQRGRPSTFVLDPPAAAAMLSPLDQLDAMFGPPVEAEVCKGVQRCAPVCNDVQPGATVCNSTRALTAANFQNPCAVSRVLTPADPAAARAAAGVAPSRSADLPRLPWAADGGLSGDDLKAAVFRHDVRLLRHLFDQAAGMAWLEASDDNWLRFLQGCHHCATATLNARMGRLVAFVKGNEAQGIAKLDCSRLRQRSEDWARKLIAKQFRDPALVALGRSMAGEEVF